jgi:hypothetical protein
VLYSVAQIVMNFVILVVSGVWNFADQRNALLSDSERAIYEGMEKGTTGFDKIRNRPCGKICWR